VFRLAAYSGWIEWESGRREKNHGEQRSDSVLLSHRKHEANGGVGRGRSGGSGLKEAENTRAEELLEYDAIILGSPVYYGSMAAEMKKLLDDSVEFHGRMEGKVGAAFASSANIGGGNETTVLNMLNALLIHGMVVQGNPAGDHYGPVSIGAPDARVEKQCRELGRRTVQLAEKLA
jgi:NAD(P)H dehydrogenase (quinone)